MRIDQDKGRMQRILIGCLCDIARAEMARRPHVVPLNLRRACRGHAEKDASLTLAKWLLSVG